MVTCSRAFPALDAGYMQFALSFDWFTALFVSVLLVRVITLALVARHSFENFSISINHEMLYHASRLAFALGV